MHKNRILYIKYVKRKLNSYCTWDIEVILYFILLNKEKLIFG